jgi:hypothetical protein
MIMIFIPDKAAGLAAIAAKSCALAHTNRLARQLQLSRDRPNRQAFDERDPGASESRASPWAGAATSLRGLW